jgi:hypothetical protein
MKRFMGLFISISAFVVVGLSVPVYAEGEKTDEGIQLLREQIKTERDAVVKANLTLTSQQREDFWPLYREYHEKRDKLMDRRVEILTDFGESRIGITTKKAEQILKEAIDLEKDIVKLKGKYRSKFVKVLLPRSALRYYQIENKIDTMIDYDISMIVPLQPM